MDAEYDDGAVSGVGRLTVTEAISDPTRTGRGVRTRPKTRAARRTIALDTETVEALKLHLKGYGGDPAGRVFTTPGGSRGPGGTLNASNFSRVWRRALRETGLDVAFGFKTVTKRFRREGKVVSQQVEPLAPPDPHLTFTEIPPQHAACWLHKMQAASRLHVGAAMDEVFKALADANRRRLLDRLNARNGQSLRELCAGLDVARQSVSKHLAVLEAANLVTTLRRGREKLHYLNAVPINAIAERWINQYDRERAGALADLKAALEQTPMTSTEFVYTIYIKTTPERLWQALTDPAFTGRYWGATFATDWAVGSAMTWQEAGVTIADPAQVVLESEPHRRLAYTWHTFTPEWARAHGVSDEVLVKVAGERRSRVAFEIEPLGQTVKLTVVHDDFEPGSTLRGMVSEGWPQLLSDLKTMLETGETVPAPLDTTSPNAKGA